jgi:hypothetical protein
MERVLVACTDIDGLMQTLNINHNPLDWSISQWQHPTFYSCWSFSA